MNLNEAIEILENKGYIVENVYPSQEDQKRENDQSSEFFRLQGRLSGLYEMYKEKKNLYIDGEISLDEWNKIKEKFKVEIKKVIDNLNVCFNLK